MYRLVSLVSIFSLCLSSSLKAQRIADHNTLGWAASFNTIHINQRYSIWLEYQWRRDQLVADWQQSLFRTGIQAHLKNGLHLMAGYGYIITFPHGDFPAGPHPVPEHRIFEQLMWNDAIRRVSLNHRFRFEQRFLGKIDQLASEKVVTDWTYLNRIRYQLRATIPLNKRSMSDDTWYLAAFEEIFIGFGKNVNQNVFDQNRVGLLLGYQVSKHVRAEAGYFNVIVQQGGLINGREVFQYNQGVMANLYLTLNN